MSLCTLYITISPTCVEFQIGTTPTVRLQHCGDVEHVIRIISELKAVHNEADVVVVDVSET